MALNLELEAGESIRIGDVTVRLEAKTGKRARLNIDNPSHVSVKLQRAGSIPEPAARQQAISARPTAPAVPDAPPEPAKPFLTRGRPVPA